MEKPAWREISAEKPFKLEFVCLGNICRSPTGEGIFIDLVKKAGLEAFFVIDSSGLGPWHVGEPAHKTSQLVANRRGVKLPSIGRQFNEIDFDRFDLILAMDFENRSGILKQARSAADSSKVFLLRDFDPISPGTEVPDPYYGGMPDFEAVFDICKRSCESLFDQLEKRVRR